MAIPKRRRAFAALAALQEPEFAGLLRAPRRAAGDETDIARVHGESYTPSVLSRVPRDGHAALDPDTILSPGSEARR